MAKRTRYTHQHFESATEQGKFTKICDDMMDSPAWQALNRSQRCLYLELKRKYTQKVAHGQIISTNTENISMPTTEAKLLYPDLRLFRTDIDRLIECGFINLVQSGWNTRTVNIYGFSDRWKKYGKPDYQVPYQVQRQKHSGRSINV